MIRNEGVRPIVRAVADALAGPILSEVKSEPVRQLTHAVLALLDRLSSVLEEGDQIARHYLEQMAHVERGLAELTAATHSDEQADSTERSPREQLDARITRLHARIAEPDLYGFLVERLKNGDEPTLLWLRETLALLLAVNNQFDDAFVSRNTRGQAPTVSLPIPVRQRLAAYLTKRYPELPADPVADYAVAAGGFSKLTALLTLKPNDVLPDRLVLRMDIGADTTQAQLSTEYPVLQRVFALGLPVPEVVLFEPDPIPLGGEFLIMSQIMDAKLAGSPIPEDRRRGDTTMGPEFLREAAKVLARLHRQTIETNVSDPSIERDRSARVDALLKDWRGMDRPSFSLAVDLGSAWMAAHPLPAGRPICLVHRDFAAHNLLTRNGHLAAVLDWELAGRGDPAEDLSLCKMMLVDGSNEWDEFAKAYIEHGGLAEGCDPHALAFFAIQIYLQHNVNFTRVLTACLAGKRTDFTGVFLSSHSLARMALYESRALQSALMLSSPAS